ncbi:probable hemagglutinin [uncultured Candidatus Thioglobus sp.]|nr:probable hemagglutinin [uncultured Candidatus Thioglobus sp.]
MQMKFSASGGFFGGKSKSSVESKQSTTQGSVLDINNTLNIQTQQTQIIASKIQAKTIQITTDLLSLISGKDLDYLKEESDSSGLLTRTITDKGYQAEIIKEAIIQAESISVNGQALHAGLGCAISSAKGGDCSSGAVGAAIGEMIAESYVKSQGERLVTNSDDVYNEAKLIGQLGAIFTAQAADLDVNDAYDTSSNAIENNTKVLVALGKTSLKLGKKTSIQGGGRFRERYKDKKGNIYEWDSRHGTLEKYNKRGKHLGKYDSKIGKQLKPANKTRKVEP